MKYTLIYLIFVKVTFPIKPFTRLYLIDGLANTKIRFKFNFNNPLNQQTINFANYVGQADTFDALDTMHCRIASNWFHDKMPTGFCYILCACAICNNCTYLFYWILLFSLAREYNLQLGVWSVYQVSYIIIWVFNIHSMMLPATVCVYSETSYRIRTFIYGFTALRLYPTYPTCYCTTGVTIYNISF